MLHRRGVECVVFEQASGDPGSRCRHQHSASRNQGACGARLLPKLDAVGIRTKELHYISRLRSEGVELNCADWTPSFRAASRSSPLHRGRLRQVIDDEVMRAGCWGVRTGLRFKASSRTEGGVVAHFTTRGPGRAARRARHVLVGADASIRGATVRFYPKQGRPKWQGLMLGAARRMAES